jgi:hypothetical protein
MPFRNASFLGRLGLGLLLVALAATAHAQYAGSLRGTISDTTGAVVPGATVTLVNEANKFTRHMTSDAEGGYYFGGVEPGQYTLTVEIPGFKTGTYSSIRISPNDTRSLNVSLEVGQQTETIEVTAEREMIQTETGAREGLITAEQIDNLSIISRSPMELLRILPGVVSPEANRLESVGNLTGANATNGDSLPGQGYQVNGVRGSNTVIALDGTKLLDIGSNNGVIIAMNNDMVSEVKVQSSNYAAEFGSAGVQVNAITKGGGSEFHGSVYNYSRVHQLAANDRSNSIAGVVKPESKFHYPGGQISGPILIPGTDFNKDRDKAFFFFGMERQIQSVDSGSTFAVVPTLGQRNGDFSDNIGGQNLNQPTEVLIPQGFPGAGSTAPGNNLAPYADPFGQMLLNQWPDPNYNDPDNRYNYVFNKLQDQNRWQFVARFDYAFSENTKAYVRLARDTELLENARGPWWAASEVELPSALNHENKGLSGSVSLTSVLSPTTTNEVVFSYGKLYLDIYYKDPEKVSLSALGFPGFEGIWGNQADVIPGMVNWSGQAGGNMWTAMGNNLYAYNDTMMVRDTFTKVLNTHAIKAGFSFERVGKDQNFQNYEEGYFDTGPGWIPGSTNSHFGDILVGRPATWYQGTKTRDGNFRLWNIDFFVQDSWKIRRNFTLEYGVRFSKMTFNQEKNGLGSMFDPTTYDPNGGTFQNDQYFLNGARYVELGQIDDNLNGARPLYIMPRVNFAWDLKGDGDMILRGGAGVFYNRPMGNAEYDVVRQTPYAFNSGFDAWSGTSLGGGEGLTYNTLPLVDPINRVGRLGFTSVSPNSVDYPRYFTGSLGLSKRLPWNQTVEVSYVGTFGRHLLNQKNQNIIPEGTFLSGTIGNADMSNPLHRVALATDVVNSFQLYPAIGDVSLWEYNGTSNYHSLQATLTRTGRNFQYFLSYTFSKALGNWPREYTAMDPFDGRNRSYGILPYDRTHILNLSYNWQLPDFVKGGNAFARGLLNGWQISGISSWASGVPIYLTFDGGINSGGIEQAIYGTPDVEVGNGRSGVQPIYTCDPNLGGTDVGEKVLDVGCVGFPAFPSGGWGFPPYYMRSPSRMNHDITVFKNFELGGSKRLQFRVGIFNIFNQAQATYNAGWTDIDLQLNTECNVRVNGVPDGAGGTQDNVCDPTAGYYFTEQSLQNFGDILLLRGHRVIELALKFYF